MESRFAATPNAEFFNKIRHDRPLGTVRTDIPNRMSDLWLETVEP
jgi:hypothetical protein